MGTSEAAACRSRRPPGVPENYCKLASSSLVTEVMPRENGVLDEQQMLA